MALRVAKGMFRLWLVLSVLWVGGVATVTWYDLPDSPPERISALPVVDRSQNLPAPFGIGGSREDIGKHYDDYLRFGAMSPGEQQGALAKLHDDTNLSINERRRIEKLMLDRRGTEPPQGVPAGSRLQQNSTGLKRWLAPDGTVYSPTGLMVGKIPPLKDEDIKDWVDPNAPAFDPSKPFASATTGHFVPVDYDPFSNTPAIKFGAELALIPPVFVLLLGSAFGWAFRGFW